MNRPDLIESLCNIILEDSSLKSEANALLTDLTSNKIDLQDALTRYNALIQKKRGYWVGKLKSKVVYSALKKYQKGEQSLLDTIKMISSLITHSIIELQTDSSITAKDLGIPELIDLLSISLFDSSNPEFPKRLNEVLLEYGYLDEKEGE